MVTGASNQGLAVRCLVLLLSACAPKPIVSIQVQIVTTSCEEGTNPFEGVQFLRLRVTGDGIAVPRDSVAPTGGSVRQLTLSGISAGKGRVIEVRGFASDPTRGGRVLSVGKSLPFEVVEVIADPADNPPIAVTVFLRKVNAFTQPAAATSAQTCQKMQVARAGHTATAMKNGKVLIAGGYHLDPGSSARVSLSGAEFFNPATNAFEPAPPMEIAKAFHTATLLTNGQVLLWGGETYSNQSTDPPIPRVEVLIYDADANAFGKVKNRSNPPAIARARHQAAIDANGKVLIVGGETAVAPPNPLVAADRVEWFDPATYEYKVIEGVVLPRKGAAAFAVRGGALIAVAGGTDGTTMVNEIVFFKWDTARLSFIPEKGPTPPLLAPPGRRLAAVATLREGIELLVLGGYSDPKSRLPIASSEIVDTSVSKVVAGPSIGSSGPGGRGDLCAAQLPDGKVLATGGFTVEGSGPNGRSDGSTVIISSISSGGATVIGGPALSIPRYHHTCTTLSDGSVLVLGGVNEHEDGSQEILNDAWIFQPAPTTP